MISPNQQISLDSRRPSFRGVNAVRTFPVGFERLKSSSTSKDNAKEISLEDQDNEDIKEISLEDQDNEDINLSFQGHEVTGSEDEDNAMSSMGVNQSPPSRSQDGDYGWTTAPLYSPYEGEGLNQSRTFEDCGAFGKGKNHYVDEKKAKILARQDGDGQVAKSSCHQDKVAQDSNHNHSPSRTSQDYLKSGRRKRGVIFLDSDTFVPSQVHHKVHIKVDGSKQSPRPTSQDYSTLIQRKKEIFSQKAYGQGINQSYVNHKEHRKDSSKVESHMNDSSKAEVKKVLHLFREVLERLLHDEGTKGCNAKSSFPMKAAKMLEMDLRWINTRQCTGDIPGIEVGDKFNWMAELNVVGLHHQYLSGIDYMSKYGKIIATSIVASGRYANSSDGDTLIYSGHGGNPSVVHGRLPTDQKLERGNLALKNSMEERTPVRVIKGLNYSKTKVYVYDGLYYVNDFWQEKGPFGKYVFKFSLKRILGQPKLPKI